MERSSSDGRSSASRPHRRIGGHRLDRRWGGRLAPARPSFPPLAHRAATVSRGDGSLPPQSGHDTKLERRPGRLRRLVGVPSASRLAQARNARHRAVSLPCRRDRQIVRRPRDWAPSRHRADRHRSAANWSAPNARGGAGVDAPAAVPAPTRRGHGVARWHPFAVRSCPWCPGQSGTGRTQPGRGRPDPRQPIAQRRPTVPASGAARIGVTQERARPAAAGLTQAQCRPIV